MSVFNEDVINVQKNHREEFFVVFNVIVMGLRIVTRHEQTTEKRFCSPGDDHLKSNYEYVVISQSTTQKPKN